MDQPDILIKLIKTKFRRLSLNCHPDRFPNDNVKTDEFIRLKLASELLLDDKWRQRYNQFIGDKTLQAKRIAK